PRLLPLGAALAVPRGLRTTVPLRTVLAETGHVAPGGDRETVRPRPGVGPGAERCGGERLSARCGLPDRPLSRQGDGAEPAGAAVRQPAVRTDLERELRGPRADHDGRGHRYRLPRRVLRRYRRRA